MKIWTVLASLVVASPATAAEDLYRWVDEKGQVTYSDLPPPPSVEVARQKRFGEKAGTQQLPYALQVATRNFPVTLYTTDCGAACDQAGKLLTTRGVPFTQKNAKDPQVAAELMKLADGKLIAPMLLVGKSAVKGFEEGAWQSALDIAGYPKSNQLPGNYPIKKLAESQAPAADKDAGQKPKE